MHLGKLLLLVPLVALTGCFPDSEFRGVPAGGGGFWDAWHGTTSRAPARAPQNQPNMTGTAGAMLAREQHGAVNAENCYDMEARFKRAGRRVRLVGVRQNDLGVGGVLKVICDFEDDGSGEANSGYYEPQY